MTRWRVRAVQAHDERTGNCRYAKAREQAHARRNAIRALLGNLGKIIQEAKNSVRQCHEQCDPDVWVRQVAPEQDADHQAQPDQETAHCRRALLRQLRFQRQVADRLALTLPGTEEVDDCVSEQDGHKERRHHGRAGPECDIVQNVKYTAVCGQPFV